MLLLVILTIGCQRKPIEIRHQPELKVLDRWSSGEVDNGAILSQWWESFRDPVLSQLHSIHRQRLDTRDELHLALGGGFENAQPEKDLQNPR